MKVLFHHGEFSKRRKAALLKKAHMYGTRLKKYIKENNTKVPEYALFVAGDIAYQKSLKKSLKDFKDIQHVVLVGIGGSSLGTEAVYQALAYKTGPSLSVIDSIDRDALEKLALVLKEFKNPRQVALVIVSKSGTTIETITNATRVIELFVRAYGKSFEHRIVFIGDKDTPFFKLGKKHKAVCIELPESVGGRFSVFTAVGIVPLLLLNIDVVSLREGALEAISAHALKQIEERAVSLVLHAEAGVHTVNFFTFNKRLEHCGLWYRQLLAESIGKNMTTKGTSFQHQLLPIVSSGVDLHSMVQLYLSGYKDLYTIFVYFDDAHPYHVSIKHWFHEHFPTLKGKELHEINDAILKAVFHAYQDQKMPYRVMEMSRCTAFDIGFLLGTLMTEVLYLGHLLNVNPFDQPAVELYKKYTRVSLGIQ